MCIAQCTACGAYIYPTETKGTRRRGDRLVDVVLVRFLDYRVQRNSADGNRPWHYRLDHPVVKMKNDGRPQEKPKYIYWDPCGPVALKDFSPRSVKVVVASELLQFRTKDLLARYAA